MQLFAPCRYALGQRLVILDEDPALMLAGMHPRVGCRILLRISVAPDRLHIDPIREGARVHESKGPVQPGVGLSLG